MADKEKAVSNQSGGNANAENPDPSKTSQTKNLMPNPKKASDAKDVE